MIASDKFTKNKYKIFKILIAIMLIFAVTIIVKMDYEIYDKPIATVTSVKSKYLYSKKNAGEKYEEKYYEQQINARLRNGKFAGKKVELKNQYAKSCVYDVKYNAGDYIFIDKLGENKGSLRGIPGGLKRDYIIAFSLMTLFILFIFIAGKDGLMTSLSLCLNLLVFYIVLCLYFKGFNILCLTIPMVIVFIFLLLVFLNGAGKITWIGFFSSVTVIMMVMLITRLVMAFSAKPDYDFMDFLIQPYSPLDAERIFISQIIIGCTGAVMDVTITVVITLTEIAARSDNISAKELFISSRNVGDDMVGTMIPVMFFTNIATDIPFFILSLRNSMTIHSIIVHHCFFAAARFLTGSIAVVISVPVAFSCTIIALRRTRRRRYAD